MSTTTCQHCSGAGYVRSKRKGFLIDLCRRCCGHGSHQPPRALGFRERVSYAVVDWLCARRTVKT